MDAALTAAGLDGFRWSRPHHFNELEVLWTPQAPASGGWMPDEAHEAMHWTKMHRRWLGELTFAHSAQHLAREEMLQRIERAGHCATG